MLVVGGGSRTRSVVVTADTNDGGRPHGLGTGANLTLRVGGEDVYKSPHFRDYSYDKNRSNYSKPVPVRAGGLEIKVAGEESRDNRNLT